MWQSPVDFSKFYRSFAKQYIFPLSFDPNFDPQVTSLQFVRSHHTSLLNFWHHQQLPANFSYPSSSNQSSSSIPHLLVFLPFPNLEPSVSTWRESGRESSALGPAWGTAWRTARPSVGFNFVDNWYWNRVWNVFEDGDMDFFVDWNVFDDWNFDFLDHWNCFGVMVVDGVDFVRHVDFYVLTGEERIRKVRFR